MDPLGRSRSKHERPDFSPVASSAALTIFALVGVLSRAGATRRLDRSVRRRMHPRKNVSLTRTATAISAIGAPHMRPVFAGSVAIGCHALGARSPWRIVAASLCATALNKSSRLVLRQKRPPGAGLHHGLDVFAYPSGHCCAVAAITTAAVRQLSRGRSTDVRAALIAAGAIASLATAWSRLYLDEHWMDDVLGGLCAGVGIGLKLTAA